MHKKKSHIKCEFCSFVTTNGYMLRKHKSSMHPMSKSYPTDSQDDDRKIIKSRHETLKESPQSDTSMDDENAENECDNEEDVKENVENDTSNEMKTLENAEDEYWTFEEIAFSCQQCEFIATSESGLGEHTAAVHYQPSREIKDEVAPCDTASNQTNDLFQQDDEIAKDDTKFISSNEPQNKEEIKKESEQISHMVTHSTQRKPKMKCSQCDHITTSVWMTSKHEKVAHGIPYEFICDSCGVDFQTHGKLKRHQISHSDKKNKCGLCTFQAARKESVKRHLKYVHGADKIDMTCKSCDFEADEHEKLEAHIKDTHADTAELSTCGKCKFSSYHDPSFKAHVKSMHNTKCELCSHEAASSKRLQMHILSWHMRPTGGSLN